MSIDVDSSLKDYFTLLFSSPSLQTRELPSPLKIVLDPAYIAKIKQTVYKQHLSNGISHFYADLWTQIGIVYSDPYIYVLRDAVIFPDQSCGTYKRVILKSYIDQKTPVAILPMTKQHEVVLILTWRHATQNWEAEIPRGLCEVNETTVEAAKRELIEETGYFSEDLIFLGSLCPDSGILNYNVSIFFAFVDKYQTCNNQKDPAEIIQNVIKMDLNCLDQAIQQGLITHRINDKESFIPFRDPFLTYALYQAKIRGLIRSSY